MKARMQLELGIFFSGGEIWVLGCVGGVGSRLRLASIGLLKRRRKEVLQREGGGSPAS